MKPIFIFFIVYLIIYITCLAISSVERERPYKFEDIFNGIVIFVGTLILLILLIFSIIEYVKLFILG